METMETPMYDTTGHNTAVCDKTFFSTVTYDYVIISFESQ